MANPRPGDARDRRDVAHEIELEIAVERRVHRVGRDRHQDRVAVRRGLGDVFGADIAGGARPVLDHELLAEPLRQMLPREPRDGVGCAAGRERDDQMHRPRRVSLRAGEARCGRKHGSGCGQAQKSAARKCHGVPPRGIRWATQVAARPFCDDATSPRRGAEARPLIRASLRRPDADGSRLWRICGILGPHVFRQSGR